MITKAIISVAGWEVDRLPISKAVGAHMLPLGNRPAIDYVVQDCVLAGVREIYFVVNKGDIALEQYYSRIQNLENYLQIASKQDYLKYTYPPQHVRFYYIEQDMSQKYGTAIPVSLCAPYIKPGESVAVLSGDDIIFNSDGSSELSRLILATPDGASSVSVASVPANRAHRYGQVEYNYDGTFYQISHGREMAGDSSVVVNVSKYIFSYDMVQMIAAYASVEVSGEYNITDPINQYALTGGAFITLPIQGQYIDASDVYSWLYGNRMILEA